MWAVVIVPVEPVWHFGGSLVGVVIRFCVEPFAQGALDEAFGLSVGARAVWPGADMAQLIAPACGSEVMGGGRGRNRTRDRCLPLGHRAGSCTLIGRPLQSLHRAEGGATVGCSASALVRQNLRLEEWRISGSS